LFEFVFAFAYRYRQKISLSLCKIIASATFGCRHCFKTADFCSTASCVFFIYRRKDGISFSEDKRESIWRMVSTAPSCCLKSENFAAQNLLHSVHYLFATCSIFPLICYMLMLVLLESTTRFWQDVAEASLLVTRGRPGFPGTRRTAVSLLPQLVHSRKAHAWSS